jgi:hypothetical protein
MHGSQACRPELLFMAGADGLQQMSCHCRHDLCFRRSVIWQSAGPGGQHPGVSPVLQLPSRLVCLPHSPPGACPQQCAGKPQGTGLQPTGSAAQLDGCSVQQLQCCCQSQVGPVTKVCQICKRLKRLPACSVFLSVGQCANQLMPAQLQCCKLTACSLQHCSSSQAWHEIISGLMPH